jgi:hypothetical protein
VLSDAKVREITKEFICVNVDPRKVPRDHPALEHKSTRFVPEIVLLTPDEEAFDSVDDRDPEDFAATLQKALEKMKR